MVDPDGRVLLLCGHDPTSSDAGHWWFLPGGGLEDGETAEVAAHRELFEETAMAGLTLVEVARRTARYRFSGDIVTQHEVLYATATTMTAIDTSRWTDIERASITEFRWWTRDELARSVERIYPEDLLDLVDLFEARA